MGLDDIPVIGDLFGAGHDTAQLLHELVKYFPLILIIAGAGIVVQGISVAKR